MKGDGRGGEKEKMAANNGQVLVNSDGMLPPSDSRCHVNVVKKLPHVCRAPNFVVWSVTIKEDWVL